MLGRAVRNTQVRTADICPKPTLAAGTPDPHSGANVEVPWGSSLIEGKRIYTGSTRRAARR